MTTVDSRVYDALENHLEQALDWAPVIDASPHLWRGTVEPPFSISGIKATHGAVELLFQPAPKGALRSSDSFAFFATVWLPRSTTRARDLTEKVGLVREALRGHRALLTDEEPFVRISVDGETATRSPSQDENFRFHRLAWALTAEIRS